MNSVVVAQLVEWSLPTPEVRSSKPVIRKNYIVHLLTVNIVEKMKIKKEKPGMAFANVVGIFFASVQW